MDDFWIEIGQKLVNNISHKIWKMLYRMKTKFFNIISAQEKYELIRNIKFSIQVNTKSYWKNSHYMVYEVNSLSFEVMLWES